jgi:hypothetical protein
MRWWCIFEARSAAGGKSARRYPLFIADGDVSAEVARRLLWRAGSQTEAVVFMNSWGERRRYTRRDLA